MPSFLSNLYLAIHSTPSNCLFSQVRVKVSCVWPEFYIFIPKMHLEKHNTKALHHLILTAYGNTNLKIEYSLVSNIYSTPIPFFSKWVWIGTRVRHFCISEFAPKMDELEFSHLKLLGSLVGHLTSKLQSLARILECTIFPWYFLWLWSIALDDWFRRVFNFKMYWALYDGIGRIEMENWAWVWDLIIMLYYKRKVQRKKPFDCSSWIN